MKGGKWEDLNMDSLVNVFGRVGIESLLLDVPFMCKSWYKATLKGALLYVADEIPNLMSKWKNLAILRLGGTFHLQEILAQINIHCKNFIGLGIPRAYIKQDEASAIVTLLPNIKQLSLRHASMEKENLVMILQGCKELKYFDVRDCIGFDEGDDEILKLASHIRTFKHKGLMLYDYNDDYCPSYRAYGFRDGDVSDKSVLYNVFAWDCQPRLNSRNSPLCCLMEGEKWKELNMHCLVNVLGIVGIESLLIDVPFGCKSWYKATRSLLCWRKLDFLEISLDDCTFLFFLARLIDDYQVKGKFSFTAIVKTLVMRSATSTVYVSLPGSSFCDEVLSYIADYIHCKNFAGFSAFYATIKKDEATSIVTSVPNIEYLGLRYSNIDRESLSMDLKG
ncbi:unnamed protein product [Camellia sinensis]